ncbi:MAG: M13 family metallopeptidase [Thermoanaerobaculia bacterium]
MLIAIGSSSLAQTPASAAAGAAPAASIGIDLAGLDRSVAPGDDFFLYANGTWYKNTEIPADRGSFGAGAQLGELTAKRTADLITEAAKTQAPAGSDARKVGDFYASFMDEAAIEAKGIAPLQPMLARIAAIKTAQGLAQILGQGLRADVDVLNSTNFYTDNLLGLWVAQDLNDPSRYLPFLLQGGLGMPDRDYYLDPSPRMAEIRTTYQAHIAAVLKLAKMADADAKATGIFDLERRIAEAHLSRVDSEDVEKGNNHWLRADFDVKAPGLDWKVYFGAAGLGTQKEFVVWQPAAMTSLSALVRSQPLPIWKDYLAYRAIEHYSPVLSKGFVDERFAFYGKTLAGTPQLRDRWKRGVSATDAALGEVVGKLYVTKYFPPAHKALVEAMVKNELAAFGRRIDALDWMSPETKKKAKAKLAVLRVGVGYPDRWQDYSGYQVVRGDAFGNTERASLFDTRQKLARLGRPVDRNEWVMNPQLVNAVNLPAMNAMNFPAAILQPPYFDPARPAVMNYGSIGAIIGHEISHSFDDQGALFDATGRLRNWWTKEDFAHFRASAEQLIKQYDGYKPFPDLAVSGKLTLSENIADLAGLAAAYDAYRLSLAGKDAAPIDGVTGDQQFFIAFGQSWRGKSREASLRQQVMLDAHSPSEFRADMVRNLDAWYAAFDVKPGQKLALLPADRIRIW